MSISTEIDEVNLDWILEQQETLLETGPLLKDGKMMYQDIYVYIFRE